MSDIAHEETARRIKTLERTLEIIGWQIQSIDIDLPNDRARIELKNGDLHVLFDGTARSHTFEREIRRWIDGAKRYSGRWETVLIGRTRVQSIGWRAGLRLLCTYLAENGTHRIEAAQVRAAIAPLMG